MAARADEEIILGFAGVSVLVIGDVMLDEYVWGEVRRISPEAPVPVVECSHRTYAPGGAANVATNIAGLGGRALLGGVVGTDTSAINLQDTLQKGGVQADGLVADATRPTTTKTRIVAHSHQMIRLDSERRDALSGALESELLAWAAQQMPYVGACMLSDYGKGVVSLSLARCLMDIAADHKKPIVVDPKGTNYRKYCGATVITPNVHEVERAVNREITCEADVLESGDLLLDQLEGTALLMTRGAEGMSLLRANTPPLHIPTVARSVYDVTGAGDTVASTLALALAVGAPLEQAALIANRAAGIVVGKLGTARVSREELLHSHAENENQNLNYK